MLRLYLFDATKMGAKPAEVLVAMFQMLVSMFPAGGEFYQSCVAEYYILIYKYILFN